jgi:hypothetical protein
MTLKVISPLLEQLSSAAADGTEGLMRAYVDSRQQQERRSLLHRQEILV